MYKIRLFSLIFILFALQIANAQKKTKPQPTPKALRTTVTLDKVNGLYVGIENPVTIQAGNALPLDISATCKKGEVKTNEKGEQTLVCTKPGLDTLVVIAPDGTVGRFSFKLKKLPDPVAKLNGQFLSGTISPADLKTCNEIKAVFDLFAYDPKCVISGFNFTYIPKKQEPVSLVATSAKFDAKIAEQIIKAKPGDYYMFSNISTKCQGDITARVIAPIFFTIN